MGRGDRMRAGDFAEVHRDTQKLGAAICVVREGAWVRFFAALPSCVRAGRMTADCSGEGKGKSEWRILLYSANLLR